MTDASPSPTSDVSDFIPAPTPMAPRLSGAEVVECISSHRRELCGKILDHIKEFVVCEGCRGLYRADTNVGRCSVCGHYRFSSDPVENAQTVREAGTHTLAINTACLPRTLKQFMAS